LKKNAPKYPEIYKYTEILSHVFNISRLTPKPKKKRGVTFLIIGESRINEEVKHGQNLMPTLL